MAELFTVPPEEFVARRDQLVRELRQAGDKAAAGEVKALRRPTVAAWAVNQLAARHPEELSELVALGERLREAHGALLEGAGTASIREITTEQRRLVAELTDTAVGLLGKAGEAQRDAIGHTLDAAVADPAQGELVRAGRLTKELAAPSGFGGFDVLFEPVTTASRRQTTTTDSDSHAGDSDADTADDDVVLAATAAARAEEERAQRRRQELEQREREARVERLRRELARRESEATNAAQAAEALREELEGLKGRLDVAQRRAAAAGDAANAARSELERAEAGR